MTHSSQREDAFALSDEVVETVARHRPISATFWGVKGHDDEWGDLSPDGHDRIAAELAGFVPRVPQSRADDGPWDRLAADVLRDFLAIELDAHAHGDHFVDLNHIASPFQLVRMVFDQMDGTTIEGWRARARRLETMDAVLDGYRRCLERGLENGHAVAARQVAAALEQGRIHSGARSYFRTLPAAMQLAGVTDVDLVRRVHDVVPLACDAFARFSSWLELRYLPHARTSEGVGRERYVRAARRFLGVEIDPEETYAWGFREIAEIAQQMDALARRIAPGKTTREVLALLQTDATYSAPDADAFLRVMRARQEQALAQLTGAQFDVPEPVRTLDVVLAPPGGPIGAYYVGPTDGFARRGAVWYSPGDRERFPLFDEIATAHHEGFPGHHLQVGIQVSLTDRLSRLHRVADGYSGYAEGWALYAERLMAELGYYERPEYLFGQLSCQMARACRVVIDIGAHLALRLPASQPFHPDEPWSFELGVEMLETMAGMATERARSEMTRYLGWPGQAISYKVGERVILELRESERSRLGAAFDAKDFHARVLGCGNVGLDHLKRLVLAG